ncbi:LysE family transporter, partial [Candidatus Pelagibacter sp.]|nr:LysE family transporter [Candidatus Pelagibacter sp.]
TKDIAKFNILLKTLGFTYLNPHVYSDTVFFLGNFSKNFLINQKVLFGLGASIASFLFFFLIGYLSKFLSKYAQNQKIWKVINIFIITFMSFLTLYIFLELI